MVTMRAARYEAEGAARDVLRVEEVERPDPGPGEVRVRIRYSALNPTDVKTRSGATHRPIDGFQVPHQDGVGVIDAVGEGVDAARGGQRVWLALAAFENRWGTAAEYAVVPAERAVPLGDRASDELGACLGVPAVTAYHCTLGDGSVRDLDVLVAGGAGAVGHYAIELAKWSGGRVISTVSGPEKGEQATAAGADVVVNYREDGAADAIRRAAPSGVDRIVEVALGANLDLDLAVSHPDTTVVTYAAEPQDPTLPVRRCMNANLILRFVLLYTIPPETLAAAMREVAAVADEGALTPLPLHPYPLDRVVEAHEAVEAGVAGKVVLDLS